MSGFGWEKKVTATPVVLADGMLQINGGVPIDTTLRKVVDQLSNQSRLWLSTTGIAFGAGANTRAIFDTSGINTSDKTFTFPNVSGTFALTSDLPTTTGLLKLGAPMDTTLRSVLDYANTSSPLQLSTTLIATTSAIQHDWVSTPTGAASKTTMWFDSTGRMSWRPGTGASSWVRTFDATTITANRVYSLPDNTMTIIGVTAAIDTTLRSVVAGGTSPLQLSTTRIGVIAAPVATTQYGLLNLGAGAFDGVTAGFFTGNAAGTIFATNSTSGYTGDFINIQKAGVARFRVANNGDTSVGNDLIILNSRYGVFGSNSSGTQGILFRATAQGVGEFNDAATGGSVRINWGGTTNAFPALARNSTNIIVCLADATAGAALGVGMASATGVNASAILQSDSTTRGFLMPRLTGAQATTLEAASPAQGLLIFVTSTNGTFTAIGWWGWNGTTWQQL